MFPPKSPNVPYGQPQQQPRLPHSLGGFSHHLDQFNASSSLDLGLPKDLQNMSDQELSALLSQKDIATSIAEDLLAQLESSGEKDPISSQNQSVHLSLHNMKDNKADRSSIFNELKIDVDAKGMVDPPSPKLDISMSASSIIEACKRHGVHGTWNWNMLSDKTPPMPSPKPYPALPKEKLYPPTPIVYVSLHRTYFN
jgi:histone demethylase